MSNEGTPAWGVFDRSGTLHSSWIYERWADDMAQQCPGRSVRPVRVIEETPKQSDYVLVPSPEHTKMCEDYKAEQAGDADQAGREASIREAVESGNGIAAFRQTFAPEQAGETVDVFVVTSNGGRLIGATDDPDRAVEWQDEFPGRIIKGGKLSTAVPDAPGVETRDVFAMLLNGKFHGAALEKGSEDFGWSYVPATLSYRRPVPAQPSLEDLIAATIRKVDGKHDKGAGALGEEIAAAVRAAFPALGEDA